MFIVLVGFSLSRIENTIVDPDEIIIIENKNACVCKLISTDSILIATSNAVWFYALLRFS